MAHAWTDDSSFRSVYNVQCQISRIWWFRYYLKIVLAVHLCAWLSKWKRAFGLYFHNEIVFDLWQSLSTLSSSSNILRKQFIASGLRHWSFFPFILTGSKTAWSHCYGYTLGSRCWSQYGMLYMRHFKELDLTERIDLQCMKYMSSFSSWLMAVIAR